jgi:hypothetical protein
MDMIMNGSLHGLSDDDFDKDLQKVYEDAECLGLDKVFLNSNSEQLQVHMDCLNGIGETITIEDVDEMGGSVFNFCNLLNISNIKLFIVLDLYSSFCSWNIAAI